MISLGAGRFCLVGVSPALLLPTPPPCSGALSEVGVAGGVLVVLSPLAGTLSLPSTFFSCSPSTGDAELNRSPLSPPLLLLSSRLSTTSLSPSREEDRLSSVKLAEVFPSSEFVRRVLLGAISDVTAGGGADSE